MTITDWLLVGILGALVAIWRELHYLHWHIVVRDQR
jgi:hypothetical protein